MRYRQLNTSAQVTELAGLVPLVLITILGWAGCFHAFYPGLLTNDSVDQFHQALAFHFSDWHPPIMAGLWSLTNILAPGPSGIFILFISLYWLGFFLVAASLWKTTSPLGYAAFLLPFLPFLINFSGTIWKDVLVFLCLITATGLLLWRRAFGIRRSLILYGPIAILLLVAAIARYNSALSVFPLCVLLFFPKPPLRRPVFTFVRNIVLLSLVGAVVIVGVGTFLNRIILRAERSGVENGLMLFDLVGISREIGQNLVPGTWTDEQSARIAYDCYQPNKWDNLAWGNCSFVTQRLRATGIWKVGLERRWVVAIFAHPIAYLQHRLAYTRSLFASSYPFVVNPDAVSVDYGFKRNLLFRGIKASLDYMQSNTYIAMLLMPGFWLAASFLLATLCAMAFLYSEQYYVPMIIALSAHFYAFPLIFVGVADDFRYVYWSIAACCVAVLSFVGELLSARKMGAAECPERCKSPDEFGGNVGGKINSTAACVRNV